ncbi:hypothetical protein HK097_011187 [Rhizophlyctis rosea]|uniref:UBA domain-containing protein n=1 Tax=Rhizophlyctis rosea TaxID=64517 RepID=A0AAD5SL80_9FUNG|nr:hypothetical protein HK097_011187 [Rhizophlyctis rosea]
MQPTQASGSPSAMRKAEVTTTAPSPIPPLGTAAGSSESGMLGRTQGSKSKPDFNYLEFEHGLAPPDPWDTRADEDDLKALREVMGGPALPPRTPEHNRQPVSNSCTPHQLTHSASVPVPPRPNTTSPTPQTSHGHGISSALLARAQTLLPEAVTSRVTAVNSYIHNRQHQPAVPPPPPKPAALQPQHTESSTAPMQYPSLVNSSRSPDSYTNPNPSYGVPGVPSGVDPGLAELYSRFTQMGFSGDAAERALKEHGSNDKKALDFAIAYDELRSKGRNPEAIASAISLFENDAQKQRKFVEAFDSLQEFGFPDAKIQEALVTKACDKEQALEWLMTSGAT